MEKLKLFSIYDTKAEFYAAPFVARNSVCARRLFARLLCDQTLPYIQAPADYALVDIGVFCDTTAAINSTSPRMICSGIEVIAELQASRGAAVGGESPLKQQSVDNVLNEGDADVSTPACDPSSFSKAHQDDVDSSTFRPDDSDINR